MYRFPSTLFVCFNVTHHKLHGSWFNNNSCAKFSFHKFVWNRHKCHSFILFEHQCHVHCLNTNVICLFVLFKHGCCMFIHVVYTWKSSTQLSCLNNAWHSCFNNMNPWNNKFHMNLKWTHEAYKFVMQIALALLTLFTSWWTLLGFLL